MNDMRILLRILLFLDWRLKNYEMMLKDLSN